jgi:hypothetical protein
MSALLPQNAAHVAPGACFGHPEVRPDRLSNTDTPHLTTTARWARAAMWAHGGAQLEPELLGLFDAMWCVGVRLVAVHGALPGACCTTCAPACVPTRQPLASPFVNARAHPWRSRARQPQQPQSKAQIGWLHCLPRTHTHTHTQTHTHTTPHSQRAACTGTRGVVLPAGLAMQRRRLSGASAASAAPAAAPPACWAVPERSTPPSHARQRAA